MAADGGGDPPSVEQVGETFAGDRKQGASILGRLERRFIDRAIPRVPEPILSHHLTALTALWSVGMVFFGWLAQDELVWLHAMSAMVFAYSFLVEAWWLELLFLILLLITCATMAVSFLSFAATNRFQIAYYGIGPTEIRIGYIALNTFVFFVGTTIFSWGVPLVVAVNAVAFVTLAAHTSRELWRLDFEANVDGAPRS